jgi:hypothetical protein
MNYLDYKCSNMKKMIVGGDFKTLSKVSSVVTKIAYFLAGEENSENRQTNLKLFNGGKPEDLENISVAGNDLIIWMPNIDNEVAKHYPKKDVGSVLICSKVLRDNRDELDAITRIFKMNGNAVIAIIPGEKFTFKLIDALGNVWYNGKSIMELVDAIWRIYAWTKASIRTRTEKGEFNNYRIDSVNLVKLAELNKIVADKFEVSCGRFFGNSSTRCAKLYPSGHNADYLFVSARNIDKKRISNEDFVPVKYHEGKIIYRGDRKPSVDTPIQASLYNKFPNIKYMIHGHSYIKGYPYTDNYFPCGDVREAHEVTNFITGDYGCVNLKNHGFLLYANSIENLEKLVNEIEFIERKLGDELI